MEGTRGVSPGGCPGRWAYPLPGASAGNADHPSASVGWPLLSRERGQTPATPRHRWCHSQVPPQPQQQPGRPPAAFPGHCSGQDVTSTYLNSNSSSATLSLNLPQECGLLPGKLFLHGGFSLALCLRHDPTGTETARSELLEHRPKKVRGVSPAPGCSCPAPPGTHQAGSSHGPGRSVPATPPGERLVVR